MLSYGVCVFVPDHVQLWVLDQVDQLPSVLGLGHENGVGGDFRQRAVHTRQHSAARCGSFDCRDGKRLDVGVAEVAVGPHVAALKSTTQLGMTYSAVVLYAERCQLV